MNTLPRNNFYLKDVPRKGKSVKGEIHLIRKIKQLSFKSCSIHTTKEEGKLRKWTSQICLGHIGLFLTAVFILILQLTT